MVKKLIALVVALAAIGSLFALGEWRWIGHVGKPVAAHTTAVKARDLTLVCPGSAFASGGSSGTNVQSFGRTGSAVVDYSSNLPGGVSLVSSPLTGPAAGQGHLGDTGNKLANLSTQSSLAITVRDQSSSASQASTTFTAQSYQIAADKGVNGAIGANCQSPASDSWLLGAVTTVGRESLLVISNPAATDATVDLQLFGESGPIDGAGLNGISISANRTVVLPLAGYAPQQHALAVHLTSRGAAVASWIQSRTVRGTVSAGADLVGPAVAPAGNLVIPGLLKRGTKDALDLISNNSDYQDLTPSVQLLVPGTKAATVTVQVIGIGTKSIGTVLQEQVQPNTATTFDLTGLKDGDYSVFVHSDQPVLSVVKLSRTKKGSTPITDFAFLPAVAPMSSPVAATAANSAVTKVSIANGGSQSASAVITDLTTGAKNSVSVPHLGSTVVSVTAGDVFAISADQPVSSSLVADFTGSLAVIPLQDFSNSSGRLAVLVH